MAAFFYWGSLVGMIICGGASVYGIVVIIKNRKTAPGGSLAKVIGGLAGVLSTGIVCYIVFTIMGIFYEPFSKRELSKQSIPQQNVTNTTYTETDFYGEWYGEKPPQ
jgi:hypothetical protein